MPRTANAILVAGWRTAAALLSIGVALVSYRYLTASDTRSPQVLANLFARPFLLVHVVCAATALLIGPFQFLARYRNRRSGLHRLVGRIYVSGCMVGAAAGFVLALGATAGPIASAGFGTLALAWFASTWLGWRRAVQRRFAEHRAWMLRSWALTFAAVTLRLYLPLPPLLGIDFLDGYRAISWLCWVINLIVVEIWLRRGSVTRAPAEGLASA